MHAFNKARKNPLVSIVILNWNGLDDTIRCLKSVKQISYGNYEVIVVDNGSKGSIKPLEKLDYINEIKLVKNQTNLGFAGGQISALPYCQGEFIFLLNNDAIIDSNAISNAVKTLESDKLIAAVGGKSYPMNDDNKDSIHYYSYQQINPITAEVHTNTIDDGKVKDVPTVSGSAVAIRVSAIKKYGYFDNRFFAYYEETDLFARYIRAGLRVVYNPSVKILHKDGESTKDKRYMYNYLMLKNQFLFAYKNFDKRHLRAFLKVYFRNFRRSLWVCLKDCKKTDLVHKARVRSSIWNLVHIVDTAISRNNVQKTNRAFSYNEYLYESQPVKVSLVIGATGKIDTKKISDKTSEIINNITLPSEVIIVSNEPFKIPKHSHEISVRNIIDKKMFSLTALDLGFMSSNTSTIIPISYLDYISISLDDLGWLIKETFWHITTNEEAFVLFSDRKIKNDLAILKNPIVKLLALSKSNLVEYMTRMNNTYSITDDTLSDYLNWSIMECEHIGLVKTCANTTPLDIIIKKSSYPILNNPSKWHIKKMARTLHLSRLLAKIFKKHKIIALQLDSNNSEENVTSITYKKLPLPTRDEILNTPIIFNSRDRVEPLKITIAWLRNSGFNKIALIDNDSTYPELLALFNNTDCQIIPLGRNGMFKSPWESFGIRFIAKGNPYIVTDPDIVPADTASYETVRELYKILYKHTNVSKVGVSLKIDDIPDHYSLKPSVIKWESRFWDKSSMIANDIYRADVDTTFALYRANTWWHLSPSLRLGGKYAMRHEPWYQDLDNPTPDMMYYRLRASNDVSTWVKGKLPKHHIRALKKEGML